MEVPQAHESVDSRESAAGGRQMSTVELPQMEAAGNGFAQQYAMDAAAVPGELLLPLLPGDRTAPHRQHAYVQSSFHDPPGRRPIDRMTVFAGHNAGSPTAYMYGGSQQLSDLDALRAARAAEPAEGFTFPYQGDGDGRHQLEGAPADGRRHAPVYVTGQLPDGRRQLEPEVSFSDMRQFSDMHQPASAYHGRVQNHGNGDGRHQSAPADGRRHAPMCVTEQLPDGRRQLVPEVSFSDMR